VRSRCFEDWVGETNVSLADRDGASGTGEIMCMADEVGTFFCCWSFFT
jgi:hypothetical protein